MRRSRGRLTLGVHKIPFLEFSPSPHGMDGRRAVGYQSPEAIEEILRILRLHLGLKPERTSIVAVAR